MSHTTKLAGVSIKDANAIRSAVMDLMNKGIKCSLMENAKPRMYYGNQGEQCEFVLKLDGAYDVGFKLDKEGNYVPQFDEWGNHVSSQIGAGAACPMPNTREGKAQHAIGQFLQMYAKHAAINAAAAQGYMVENSFIDDKGNVQLVIAVN